MIAILLLVIFILLILIDKKQGIKTFLCFTLNFLLIISFIYLACLGFNSIFIAFIICILATIVSLFLLNGINIKTISSSLSVFIVLIIMFLIIFIIGETANIQGFTSESRDIIGTFNLYINYSYSDLIIAILLICSIGTIIDTSISISTSLNEIHENNNNLSQNELYKSGINIGKDILSTTINTLFFASLGGIMTFIFWNYNSTILEIINHKMFVQEIFEMLSCFIGSIIIIPITSYITSIKLIKST